MQKLILNDNIEIDVQEGVSLSNIQTIKESILDVDELKNKLTRKGNLDKVQFKQNDEVIGEYEDMILISPMLTIDEMENGKLLVTFGLREKTDIEKRLDYLEESQEIQDGAIADLGSVVSEISM